MGYMRGGGKKELLDDISECRRGDKSLESIHDKYDKKYGRDFIERVCTEDYQANPYYGTTGRHRHVEPTYRKYPDKPNKDKGGR